MKSFKKIGLLFPGGGSHYVGMGREYYEEYSIFRQTFEEASDYLSEDMAKICFESDSTKLESMEQSQIAIYIMSIAMSRVFTLTYPTDIEAMSGHSLGEYSALTCANALSLSDGLMLVQKRGQLLHKVGQKNNGQMMAVNGLSIEEGLEIIQSLQKKDLHIYLSNINSSHQFVVSGNRNGIQTAFNEIERTDGEPRVLPIPTCSHCPLMNDAKQEYDETLSNVEINKPSITVYANIFGRPYNDEKEIRGALLEHLIEPVLWQKSFNNMVKDGVELFFEIGPQAILKSIAYQIDDQLPVLSFDEKPDRYVIDEYFKQEQEKELLDFDRKITNVVSCPNQNISQNQKIKELDKKLKSLLSEREKMIEKVDYKSEIFDRELKEFLIYKGYNDEESNLIIQNR